MDINKCLYCYKPLSDYEIDFHKKCCFKFFGLEDPPLVITNQDEVESFLSNYPGSKFSDIIENPKLPVSLARRINKTERPKINLNTDGKYFLIPQHPDYPQFPENINLTMLIAKTLDLKTAAHSLVKSTDGDLLFINRRFDKVKDKILSLYAIADLIGKPDYEASYEDIADKILSVSDYPLNDILTLFETIVFYYLTGCTNITLSKFNLMRKDDNEVLLAPLYDIYSHKLISPETEELSLTLGDKKYNFIRNDFTQFALQFGLNKVSIERTYKRFADRLPLMYNLIDESFLSVKMKFSYKKLIYEKAAQIELN